MVFAVAVWWVPSSPSSHVWLAPARERQAQPCFSALLQNFLYKCIGTTLGAASSKEVVRKQLQELLETARHQEEAEREVAAAVPRSPPGTRVRVSWPGYESTCVLP